MYQKYFSRKEFIKLSGIGLISIPAVIAAFGKTNAAPKHVIHTAVDCILTPESVEGPYYIQNALVRSDIRENKAGVLMLMKLKVVDSATCQPIPNAMVDIWHCDAAGFYSGYPGGNPDGGGMPGGRKPPPDGFHLHDGTGHRGFQPPPVADSMLRIPPNNRESHTQKGFRQPDGPGFKGFPPPGEGMRREPTAPHETFLRGVQVTGKNGEVSFTTIYPGWYAGRAIHIHCKVFLNDRLAVTTQLYLPQQLSNNVHKTHEPYKNRFPIPLTNEEDMIVEQTGGADKVLLKATKSKDKILTSLTLGVKQG